MIKYSLDHLHFRSNDIEFSRMFWSDILGAKLIKERELMGAKSFTFDLNGNYVLISGCPVGETMKESISENQYGFWHFALLVDDIFLSLEMFQKRGIECFQKPWEIRNGVKIAFIRGPDNISIELIERKDI